jgi:lipid-binding SYLF domain-containing protein
MLASPHARKGMRRNPFSRSWTTACFAALATLLASSASAQSKDDTKFVDSARVLEMFTTDQQNGIPADILQRARGIAVIPDMIRGGFLFGGRRGRGVIAIRSPNGEWSNPAFLTLTAGSFGAQFGAESADVVLVFANDRSVRNIASGKFTLGGDAAAVAGPVGTNARTVATGRAEVYVYMQSRGLFAGATFEGTRLDIDQDASAAFYRNTNGVPLGAQTPETPAAALPFLDALRSAAAAGPAVTSNGAPPATTPSAPALTEEEAAVTFPLE